MSSEDNEIEQNEEQASNGLKSVMEDVSDSLEGMEDAAANATEAVEDSLEASAKAAASGAAGTLKNAIASGYNAMMGTIGKFAVAVGVPQKIVSVILAFTTIITMVVIGDTGGYLGGDEALDTACAITLSDMNEQEDSKLDYSYDNKIARAKKIYRYLDSYGWSQAAIAGVLANALADSNIDSTRYEGDDIINDIKLMYNQRRSWTGFTEALFNIYSGATYNKYFNGVPVTEGHQMNGVFSLEVESDYTGRLVRIDPRGSLYKNKADVYQKYSDKMEPLYHFNGDKFKDDEAYCPGMGLFMWSGERAHKLIEFADAQKFVTDKDDDGHNDVLWEPVFQIAFMLYENQKNIKDKASTGPYDHKYDIVEGNNANDKDFYDSYVKVIVDNCDMYNSLVHKRSNADYDNKKAGTVDTSKLLYGTDLLEDEVHGGSVTKKSMVDPKNWDVKICYRLDFDADASSATEKFGWLVYDYFGVKFEYTSNISSESSKETCGFSTHSDNVRDHTVIDKAYNIKATPVYYSFKVKASRLSADKQTKLETNVISNTKVEKFEEKFNTWLGTTTLVKDVDYTFEQIRNVTQYTQHHYDTPNEYHNSGDQFASYEAAITGYWDWICKDNGKDVEGNKLLEKNTVSVINYKDLSNAKDAYDKAIAEFKSEKETYDNLLLKQAAVKKVFDEYKPKYDNLNNSFEAAKEMAAGAALMLARLDQIYRNDGNTFSRISKADADVIRDDYFNGFVQFAEKGYAWIQLEQAASSKADKKTVYDALNVSYNESRNELDISTKVRGYKNAISWVYSALGEIENDRVSGSGLDNLNEYYPKLRELLLYGDLAYFGFYYYGDDGGYYYSDKGNLYAISTEGEPLLYYNLGYDSGLNGGARKWRSVTTDNKALLEMSSDENNPAALYFTLDDNFKLTKVDFETAGARHTFSSWQNKLNQFPKSVTVNASELVNYTLRTDDGYSNTFKPSPDSTTVKVEKTDIENELSTNSKDHISKKVSDAKAALLEKYKKILTAARKYAAEREGYESSVRTFLTNRNVYRNSGSTRTNNYTYYTYGGSGIRTEHRSSTNGVTTGTGSIYQTTEKHHYDTSKPWDQEYLKPNFARGFDKYWYIRNEVTRHAGGIAATTELKDANGNKVFPGGSAVDIWYNSSRSFEETYYKYRHRYVIKWKDESIKETINNEENDADIVIVYPEATWGDASDGEAGWVYYGFEKKVYMPGEYVNPSDFGLVKISAGGKEYTNDYLTCLNKLSLLVYANLYRPAAVRFNDTVDKSTEENYIDDRGMPAVKSTHDTANLATALLGSGIEGGGDYSEWMYTAEGENELTQSKGLYMAYRLREELSYQFAVWFYRSWKGYDFVEMNDPVFVNHTETARYWYQLMIVDSWAEEKNEYEDNSIGLSKWDGSGMKYDQDQYRYITEGMIPGKYASPDTDPSEIDFEYTKTDRGYFEDPSKYTLRNVSTGKIRDMYTSKLCNYGYFDNSSIADTAMSLSYPIGELNFSINDSVDIDKDSESPYAMRCTELYVAVANTCTRLLMNGYENRCDNGYISFGSAGVGATGFIYPYGKRKTSTKNTFDEMDYTPDDKNYLMEYDNPWISMWVVIFASGRDEIFPNQKATLAGEIQDGNWWCTFPGQFGYEPVVDVDSIGKSKVGTMGEVDPAELAKWEYVGMIIPYGKSVSPIADSSHAITMENVPKVLRPGDICVNNSTMFIYLGDSVKNNRKMRYYYKSTNADYAICMSSDTPNKEHGLVVAVKPPTDGTDEEFEKHENNKYAMTLDPDDFAIASAKNNPIEYLTKKYSSDSGFFAVFRNKSEDYELSAAYQYCHAADFSNFNDGSRYSLVKYGSDSLTQVADLGREMLFGSDSDLPRIIHRPSNIDEETFNAYIAGTKKISEAHKEAMEEAIRLAEPVKLEVVNSIHEKFGDRVAVEEDETSEPESSSGP